ncbi:MAG TPA: glycerate kinase [Solirubrobacteraceae bacterium]|jgi:glycerate 2-kinase|nr:glycerate kinase [Solirubrobacteraceae bacterium]
MDRVPAARPVLVAPDSFKGTLTAAQVADALQHGLERAGWRCDRCPAADGGDGTLDVLLAALSGELMETETHDPLARPIRAAFALVEGGARAIVETATASGLALLAEDERAPEAASTAGTGELIAAAVRSGVHEVLLGVGGSATTDGGAGAIEAVEASGGLRGARLVVLCDVRTPFERAAEVFAPQKGADPQAVRRLTRRLEHQARALPRDPRGMPMTGCAGGLSGGLWAAFGARLVPGAAFVLDALGFDARARPAAAVVTGEGRLDPQSLEGKVVGEVASRCRQRGIPCHAVVGTSALDRFGRRLLDLQTVDEAGTIADIQAAGVRLGERLADERSR